MVIGGGYADTKSVFGDKSINIKKLFTITETTNCVLSIKGIKRKQRMV